MTLRERLAHDDELELLAHHFDHPLVAMTISAQAAVAELERLFALPHTRESTTHSAEKDSVNPGPTREVRSSLPSSVSTLNPDNESMQ